MTSRRAFIKTGFVGTVAAGVSARAFAVPVMAPHRFDGDYDFIIVGAGNACLNAARCAAQAGLSVLVLEKEPVVGGSSAICGGSWAASGTQMQKDAGIQDSEELFYEDMIKTGQGVNDPALVKTYVREVNREYEWLRRQGVNALDVHAAGGMSVPRVHAFKPAQVVECYRSQAVKAGAKILLRTAATRLLWSADAGRVCGVKAVVRGKAEKNYQARYGVLLASGGFARSPELLGKYVPAMKNAWAVSGIGNTGDGLRMGLSLGADTLDMNYIKATYGFKPNGSASEKSYIYYNGGIIVNKEGKRFVNESLSYKLIGDKALMQPDAKTFTVFDNKIREAAMKSDRREIPFWKDVQAKGTSPLGYVGKTIEEVAKKAGIPAEQLVRTIKEYNATAPQGKDVFGRRTLSGGVGKPVALTEGPFVVMPATAAMIATYCGLRIDPKARVIDVYGEPISGLYAAGEITGGLHGAAYMTGTAFSKAAVFGRIAAEQVIALKKS